MLFVAGAGHESWDNDRAGVGQAFPASLPQSNIIAVAASTIDDFLRVTPRRYSARLASGRRWPRTF